MAPLLERPVACQSQAAMLVGGGHEPKQQLRTGVIQGSKTQFIDQNQLVAQQLADQLANGVVGQSAVQRFDQISRHQVAHLHATFDGAYTAAQQRVRLARARRPNQEQILFGAYPLQRGDVLKGWARDRGLSHLEALQGLDHRKATMLETNASVGCIARGDLSLQQRAQHFLGTPALRDRGLQHLRRLLTHGGQLEAAQSVDQVHGQRRRYRGDHALTAWTAYALSERTGTSGSSSARCWPACTGVGTPRPASRMARTSLALKRRKRVARSSALMTASRLQIASSSTIDVNSYSSRSVPAAAALRKNTSATGPRPTKAISAAVRGRMPRAGRRCGSTRSPHATSPGPTGS